MAYDSLTLDHSRFEAKRTLHPTAGLSIVDAKDLEPEETSVPERLITWLTDLALLRNVPFQYLVHDPVLLPPESIRMFHVDRTWTDRLIDGAFFGANVGSFEATVGIRARLSLRKQVSARLKSLGDASAPLNGDGAPQKLADWTPDDGPITGMLVRSELIARWPTLSVRAFDRVSAMANAKPLPLLRRDTLGRAILIALFAGTPRRVEIKEPIVAMRFGVETGFEVQRRSDNGSFSDVRIPVPLRPTKSGARVIDVGRFASSLPKSDSSHVALHLEQLPYVQVFEGNDDAKGSVLGVLDLLAMPGAGSILGSVPLKKENS